MEMLAEIIRRVDQLHSCLILDVYKRYKRAGGYIIEYERVNDAPIIYVAKTLEGAVEKAYAALVAGGE